jgi:hypothetical protein
MRSSRIKAFNRRSPGDSNSSSVVTSISLNNNDPNIIILEINPINDNKYYGSLSLPVSVYPFTSYDPKNPVKDPIRYRIKIRKDKINEQFTEYILVTAYAEDNNTTSLYFFTTKAIADDIESATQLDPGYSDISKVELTTNLYKVNAFDLYNNIFDGEKGGYTFLFAYPPVPFPRLN